MGAPLRSVGRDDFIERYELGLGIDERCIDVRLMPFCELVEIRGMLRMVWYHDAVLL